MINIQRGSILISNLLLDEDPYFNRSVVFITEQNEKGTVGFVINQLFGRKLNDLLEFKDSAPFKLYAGGPVARDNLFFLHRRPDIIGDGIEVADSFYMNGNFEQTLQGMKDKSITENDIKLLIGYSGWSAGQLDAEIKEGCWLAVDTSLQTIFSTNTNFLWEELFERKSFLSLN